MKKLILIGMAVITMAGCSGNTKIDCYQVSISGVFSGTYSEQNYEVNEYASGDGDYIYSNINPNSIGTSDVKFTVYNSRYSDEHKDYVFSRTVGLLTQENNYYLDLKNRVLDCELKYKEAKVDKASEEKANVKEAYNCAKKGYYFINTYFANVFIIKKDITDATLEKHTYIQYGENATVTYVKKWFK